MATPIKNVRFRYILRTPDGKTVQKDGDITGTAESRRWLVDTLLHGKPLGSKIEQLRQVTPGGREMPLEMQHPFFTEEITPRLAPPENERYGTHPGVEPPTAEEVGRPHPEAKALADHGPIPQMPDNPDMGAVLAKMHEEEQKLAAAHDTQATAPTVIVGDETKTGAAAKE